MALKSVPSPPKHWLLGNIIEIATASKRKVFPQLIFSWCQQYGEVFAIWIGSRAELVVSSPKLIKEILIEGQRSGDFIRDGRVYRAFSAIYGPHIGNQEGNEWKWRRDAWTTIATPQRFNANLASLIEIGQYLLAQIDNRLASNNIVRATPLLSEMHMRVIASLVLGVSSANGREMPTGPPFDFDRIYLALAVLERAVSMRCLPGGSLYVLLSPLSLWRLWRANRYLDSALSPWVNKAIHESSLPTPSSVQKYGPIVVPLLSELARVPQYTSRHLATDLRAVLFPRTTGHALAFLLVELAKNPLAQAKARAEVRSLLRSESDTLILTTEALSQMKYIEAVFKEAIRMHAVIPQLSVTSTRNTVVGTVCIPKGTVVHLQLMAAGYEPQMYFEPYTFLPERWLNSPNSPALPNGPPILLGFSLGKHSCFAFPLAMLEVKIALTLLLCHYEWGPAITETKGTNSDSAVATSPVDGAPLSFRRLATAPGMITT